MTTICRRLHRGDDLLLSIKAICRENHIAAGVILSGVGCLTRAVLRDADGVGLAAPQVGILRQVVLVINEDDEIIELINPEIIRTSGEQFGLEGCLSVPGRYGFVKRPMVVRVRAQDRNGNTFEVEDEGLTARCFCHEIDHLSGHLFDELVDRTYTVEEIEQMEEEGREVEE